MVLFQPFPLFLGFWEYNLNFYLVSGLVSLRLA